MHWSERERKNQSYFLGHGKRVAGKARAQGHLEGRRKNPDESYGTFLGAEKTSRRPWKVAFSLASRFGREREKLKGCAEKKVWKLGRFVLGHCDRQAEMNDMKCILFYMSVTKVRAATRQICIKTTSAPGEASKRTILKELVFFPHFQFQTTKIR